MTVLAVCGALACAAVAPSAAIAGPPPPCTKCIQFIENLAGADVHSSPGGPVIGHAEYGIEVYVLEAADEDDWCNVRFEDGPNKGNGGWILCGDL
ncbi:MAG TPA: hypothetical protein VGP18_09525 [Solirubrobacteraceae bacterium]|nr:hypothetical protein [Solirubrobacteraceae bacterium]